MADVNQIEMTSPGQFRVLTEPEFREDPEELLEAAYGEAMEAESEVLQDVQSEHTALRAEEENRKRPDDEEMRQMMSVPNLASEGIYEEILPGVDLHYTIEGECIKENIRLKTKEAARLPLIFKFTHPEMVMREESDGSLGLYTKAETGEEPQKMFELVKPYMYDRKGQVSQGVQFQVETKENASYVRVVPDQEWLLAEERAYPVVIDPRTETSKTRANIEDTYIFTGGTDSTEDPSKVHAYGSFVVGRSDGAGRIRGLLRFRNLPDIGKGSIIYAATMYAWQYQYSTYGIAKIPLTAHEIKSSWTEQSVRWSNQPGIDQTVLDYKEVGQVRSGNTITITPVGFDVTRLVRKWYNTGNNYGIMLCSKYENDSTLANRAYARFYSSDHPQMSSDQYPSGVFYYRNVNGLEDYQSYHEQEAGRAGTGYTNDFTGNLVWVHPDAQTTGGPMQAGIRHVYNSSDAQTASRMGYGWTLDCLQKLSATGITDYPYVYTDGDGTKHYFYKDTADGNKLKDEDGLGLTITATTGADDNHAMTVETKEKEKYIFGKDGFLRFIEDPDGNQITYAYRTNSGKNEIAYITDPTGARLDIVYADNTASSKVTAVKDMAGRLIQYTYDTAGNLTTITYPDGKTTRFTYDSAHKLLSVTNLDGYGVKYEYTNDFRIPRVSRITETGKENKTGQELKISYQNGNTTVFEEPGLGGEITQTADNKKTMYHFDNMGRPVDVLDSDGFANNYTYYTSGMKNHKLSKEGSVQKTVYNLLNNHLFDPVYGDGGWYTRRLSDSSKGTIVRGNGYAGTKSAKLVKSNAASEEGICQDVTLGAGTYTLSAYVKTEDMVLTDENGTVQSSEGVPKKGAGLMILHADGSRDEGDIFLDYETDAEIDEGWERLSVTFTIASTETVTVFAGILGMAGTIHVSGMQLETGKAANKLNLILNSGFERCTNGKPDYWTYKAEVTGEKSVAVSGRGRCAAITGQIDKSLYCCQAVNVSGKEGDIYSLSCWVKGCGIPGKQFRVSAKVIYSSGTEKWYHFDCNPNILDWQFVHGIFSTDNGNSNVNETYQVIHIYLNYDNQMNQVLYDGVQLIRDDGTSYVYDNDGNMISAKTAAENSHFTHNKKGAVTRMGNIEGTAFEYVYDGNNHMIKAVNSEGVKYGFTYDVNGQPIRMTAEGGTHLGAVTPGRAYYIREKYSGNYVEVQNASTTSKALIQLQSFKGTPEQKWKIFDCQDGYIRMAPMHVSGMRLDLNGASTADGAVIQMYTENNSDAQKWKLHPKRDGSYQISCKSTGDKKGLTNGAKSTVDGQQLKSYTLDDSNASQDWYFEPADEQTLSAVPADGKIVSIRVRHSGQYIDVYNLETTSGTKVMQFYYNGGRNQQFRLVGYDETYYYLETIHAPGMVVAKTTSSDNGYECLTLETKTAGAANQLFRFVEAESGKGTGYVIVCKDGNTELEVKDKSYALKTDIILTAHTSVQKNKWWILEECSERMESSMTYTSDGRQVKSITDSRGNVTSYTYDGNNRLINSATDSDGNKTSYTYDAKTDQLKKVERNANGNKHCVEYTYEDDRLKTISHNGTVYGYAYDAYGNLTGISAGITELEHTTYRNKNGLADRVTYANGEAVRNEYDAEERLTSQYLIHKDGTEEKLFTNVYDNYGNVVLRQDHRNQESCHYQYDMIGRKLGADASNGLKIHTSYDEKDRVKDYTYRVKKKGHRTEFLYGDVEKQQKPGLGYGVQVDGVDRLAYEYDALGRMKEQTICCDGGIKRPIEFEYLPGQSAGTTTNLIGAVKEGVKRTEYRYDNLGNITEVLVKEPRTGQMLTRYKFYYDQMNQLVRADDNEQKTIIIYEYDLGGNLVKRTFYDTSFGLDVTQTDTFTYRAWGNWNDQLYAYNGENFSYDYMGNPVHYRGMNIEWEKGRQLKRISSDELDAVYDYDSDGVRIKKTVNGVTTKYYLNGTAILAQESSDGERIDFLYDDQGKVFGFEYQNKLYFYRKNIQGDIIGILDSNGTERVIYVYDAWGKLLDYTDTSGKDLGRKNPFRYKGYYYDVETGMYYLSSRYYDPEVCRFKFETKK